MKNFLTYEDFQEEFGEEATESWWQDWLYEAITFKYIMLFVSRVSDITHLVGI